MNNNAQICTCPEDGYTPECPYAFVQGGKVLHEVVTNERLKVRHEVRLCQMEREAKAEPRVFNRTRTEQEAEYVGPAYDPGHEEHGHASPTFESMSSNSSDAYIDVERMLMPVRRSNTVADEIAKRANLVDANTMLANRRDILRKYESLKIGDKTLTELSIGGFNVDLSKAAQKASEIVPLPPARLPIIFKDPEMNFSHHFFQGLERLIGREQVLEIVSKTRYYRDEELVLVPLIEGILRTGYERKDTNLTVFTKSVLSSTFELDDRGGDDSGDRGLVVAANLWGFQYIEDGMECKEADMRMWLSINYDRFRNIFFNTFKDSGVPAFAMEGVQTRYEPVQRVRDARVPGLSARVTNEDPVDDILDATIKLGENMSRMMGEEYEKSDSGRSRRSHRHRKQRRQEPTLGGLFFGGRR
jgi:hypothetical protein